MRLAILDDYQNVALESADWQKLSGRVDITVFSDHIADPDRLVERLEPFDILCVMRERTPLRRDLLTRLPNLKFIASTGSVNAAIDTQAAAERGIAIAHTGYSSTPTIELTWALLLALARGLVDEVVSVRDGGWQRGLGIGLHGKTLGLLGLGNIGTEVAKIGNAFGMNVIAWSQNLTPEAAAAKNATCVAKAELFAQSDFLSIHTILSRRTRGLVDREMLALMRPSAFLINASRGAIVVEEALTEVLREHRIAGAAIDAFDEEPLPAAHPFRSLPNVLASPHIGYVTQGMYRTFYGDCVRNITAWLDSRSV